MGGNIEIKERMQSVTDRRYQGKPGRKQYTPMERIYFSRIEQQLLLGIFIAENKKGDTFHVTVERSIEILFQEVNIESSSQQIRSYKRMFYGIYHDFKGVLKRTTIC